MKGEASDVRVVRRGDDVLVVWNEGRKDGGGGVAAARLLTSDLTVRGDPAVVVSAPRHPRGLELSSFGDGVEVAWSKTRRWPGARPTELCFARV